MPSLLTAASNIAAGLFAVADELNRLIRVQSTLAEEQRVTNLIVRSQVEPDPDKKEGFLIEARRRMDAPRPEIQHPKLVASPRRMARRQR